jgi:peptide chain release factor 1
MYQKLEDVALRFEVLTEKLSDPAVAQTPSVFAKLAKERADLEETVTTYRALQRTERELSDSRALLEEESDSDLRQMAREEIERLVDQRDALESRLRLLLLPKDPLDEKNIILEIRAGTGGEEAALFAADLFRLYARYAESRRWRLEPLSEHMTEKGGIKELACLISGDHVYSDLKYESGVHRVQRVPETESQGRIHTSACTVAVLPEAEEVDLQIAEKELRIDVYRSSGPGGQSVNTTDSAVRVTHLPSGLVVTCQDEKSQHKNKAKALKILRSRLLDQMQAEQDARVSAERRSQVGSGDRSERIRTYNFPQNRLTDHRIGLTLYRLDAILQGELAEVIAALRTHYQAEALKGMSD